ncbi:MAG: 4'-phosphopantetheinyl transferase superfamily protein [Eubacteriales bacterium]|nr:4'-phosphopantetheinyl transferase superfamily protein [Eubacteriales bacterium]
MNKVKKRASLNDDGRISTENSEPFFEGSLVEICILSYAPYSVSEKHSLKHELMPFFSKTRLEKIGRLMLNPQDSSLSEKHISALEQSAAAELAICAAMKNSGRPFAPSDYAYKESGQPTIQNGHISISHTEGYAACAIAREPVGIDVEREHTFSKAAAKRILSPQEELLRESANADELLSRIWTVKESFLKMTGEGIPGEMRTLELIAAGDGSSDVWTIKRGTEPEAGCAVLLSISGSGNSADFNDAYLSVCTKRKAMMHINRFESVESILEFLNEP